MKSVDEQALQALHRTRSLWMATRTARINTLRGFYREFGIVIAQGARTGLDQIARVLAEPNSAIPELVRPTMKLLVEEIRLSRRARDNWSASSRKRRVRRPRAPRC